MWMYAPDYYIHCPSIPCNHLTAFNPPLSPEPWADTRLPLAPIPLHLISERIEFVICITISNPVHISWMPRRLQQLRRLSIKS